MSGLFRATPSDAFVRRGAFMFVAAVVAAASSAVAQVGGLGPPYFASLRFTDPTGLAVDETNGRVLVVDSATHRVLYTEIAELSGAPAWGELGYLADRAASEALTAPQGAAADGFGNVFVVDTFNGEVELYRWSLVTQGYDHDPVFAFETRRSVDGLAMSFPRDIAAGIDGRVYLLDSGNARILVADGPDDVSWSVHHTGAGWLNPYGLDVAADGTLYVADTGNHVVRRIAPDGTETTIGGFGTANGLFRAPRDVAVGSDGRLWVADTQNHRVSVFDSGARFLFNLAAAPVLGAPQKVEVDASGRVFVVDADAHALVSWLGSTVPLPYDLYVRDYFGDTGQQPFTGAVLFSPDILVRAQADVDRADAAARGLEAYLFDQPRPGQDSYAYVAIRNRGLQIAVGAVVRFYWANPSGAMAFPADWHSEGFFVPDAGGGTPTPGNALPVPDVAPRNGSVDGVQVVGPVVWRPPDALGDQKYVLLVRVLAPYDPLVAARGIADVKANNAVALRPVSTSDEALDGSFVLDLSGEVYVQLIHSKAGYATYLSLEEPSATSTCPGLSLTNCYLETRKCRTTCPQVDGDYTCACVANETRPIGRYEAGQRFAVKFLVDKDRNGSVERTYYADPTRNWDNFDHVRTYHVFQGAWLIEFEDFDNGGDRDFNDMVVMVRVVPDTVSPEAAQLPVPSLYLLSNVVVEEAAKVPDPKIRLTVLLQNSDTAQAQRAAVCPMLHFSEAREVSQVYTYRDNPDGTPGDGTPDHVGADDERISVRFSRDQRWTNTPPHPAPRAGDLFTVPSASAAGPGEVAVEYEIPISTIDALIADPASKLGGLGADALQRRIAANGLSMDLLTGIAPATLVCPNGPMTSFDGQANQVAMVKTAWTDPNTYRIASPAFIDVPTVNFQTRDPGAPPVLVHLEYFWSDNLPEHLKGHILSTIPPRSPFWAGGSAVTKVPVRLDFADDLPEGFQGKLEAFVRDVYTGNVIVTATRTFSKDNRPPAVSAVHTSRTVGGLEVIATIADPSGIGEAWLEVDVGGARRADLYLSRLSGDFRSATEMAATVGSLAPLDVVTLDLAADDRARLVTGPLRLPVANLGEPSMECNATGLSAVALDGTHSTGPADMTWEWTGPFGTATGPSPVVLVPVGTFPLELMVSDGRGFTGTQATALSVHDTISPLLEIEATPACLWPPNHKYVPFRVGANLDVQVQDACDPTPWFRVVSVSSDEPDEGLGDGDTARDVLFGDTGFCVRAERRAGGKGRTYTAVLEAVDASGNRSTRVVQVAVPHDASVDARCPYLPSSVFGEDADPRCSFGPVKDEPTLDAGSASAATDPGGALAPQGGAGWGCTTGEGGSGFGGLLVAAATLFRRRRPLSRSSAVRVGAALTLLASVGVARAGGFTAAGSMSEAREGHTATQLQDRRVLLVGGRGSAELASAEVFDPLSGMWSPAGSLASARRGHTATLLTDGRVVVIGGSAAGPYGGRVYPPTVEIYEPGAGWSTSGSLGTPRSNHTATLLADGRVLVAGGYNLGDLAACEIFDPVAGTFSPSGTLSTRRYGHEAVRLPDERVLVLGGASSSVTNTNFSATAELWSPATGQWSTAPNMLARRYRFVTALVATGVLVAGGSNDDGVLAQAELYDPVNGSTSIQALAFARTSAVAVAAGGGVVVAGGYDLGPFGAENVQSSAEVFDAAKARWSQVGSMNSPRSAASATALGDGSVLIAGGWDGNAPLATAEIISAASLEGTEPNGSGCGCGTSPVSAAAAFGLAIALASRFRRGRQQNSAESR